MNVFEKLILVRLCRHPSFHIPSHLFFIYTFTFVCALCLKKQSGGNINTHTSNTSPLYERRECMCCYVNRVRLMSVPTYSLAPHILCSRPLRNLHHFHFILYICIYSFLCCACGEKTFLIEPNTSQSFVVVVVVLYSKLFSSSPTASQVERAGGAKGCAARARAYQLKVVLWCGGDTA